VRIAWIVVALALAGGCGCPNGTESVRVGTSKTEAVCRQYCQRMYVSFDGWSPPSQEWIDQYEDYDPGDPFSEPIPEPTGVCSCCNVKAQPRQPTQPKPAPHPFGPRRQQRPVFAWAPVPGDQG